MQTANISFVNASTHFLACVDGRSANGTKTYFFLIQGILGTPGGDTGEFLCALATFVSLGGSITSQGNVSKLLDDFISLGKHFISIQRIKETIQREFYMHTDDHAMYRLEAALAGRVPNFTISNVSVPYQVAF